MTHRTHAHTSGRILTGVLVGAAILAAATLPGIGSRDDAAPDREPTEAQARAMGMARELSTAYEHAAETIEPSVVHIITERATRRGFRRQAGVGSGVIVDERGYVLTNAHVARTDASLTVRLADGREVPGEVVGSFDESDLAVLKIEADDLVPAEFGDPEALRVGQWVLAAGSPFGFEQSVTAGIVSAKGRGSIAPGAGGDGPRAAQRFQEFIQTDAAINPGNSGGPLVDLDGRVVGINTAIASRSGGNNGLGFAIPSDIARAVMERIIETGRVGRGWLGIGMARLDPERAIGLGIDGGVVVERVMEGGPAVGAGLERGDIIVEIGGRTTENLVRLSNAIMLTKPGVPVEVVYYRDGTRRVTEAVVADRDEERAIALGGVHVERIGLTVAPPEVVRPRGRRRPMFDADGLVVIDVADNTPADRAGFEAGDFIFEAGGRMLSGPESFEEAVNGLDSGARVRFRVVRAGQRGYIDMRVP